MCMSSAPYPQHLRETLRLAGPLIVAQLAAMGMNVADSVIAGRISGQALGGVAVGAAVYSFALLLTIGTLGAMTPTVAQLFGARRFDEIAPRVRQGWWIALGLGVVVMAVCLSAGPFLRAIGIDAAIEPHASDFLKGVGFGGPGLAAFFLLRGYADGMGRTKPGMVASVLSLAALIPLAWGMSLGRFGLPALGTFGLGLATAIVLWGQAIGFALYLSRAAYFRRFGKVLGIDRPDPVALKQLLGIGLPMAFAWQMEGGLFITVALLMGRIGGDWAAAHQIAVNAASVAFMIPLGMAQAVTVRVGHARGAGDITGVKRAGLSGLGLVLCTQLASATVMFTAGAFITRLYAPGAESLVPIAVHLLFLAGIFQLSDGIQVVAAGALRGLKDTRLPMVITAVAYWGIGFPLAWWLAFHTPLGAPGLWVGFIGGLTAAAILLNWRFAIMLRRLRREVA